MPLPTTRWTLLARLGEPDKRDSALELLCREYWRPVFAFLRGRGYTHEEAEDLTQGFFELVVRDRIFEQADRARGRLRSFLLGSLEHFTANAARTRSAFKRGAGRPVLSLHAPEALDELEVLTAGSATPAEAFDRAWLAMLIQHVVQALRQQYDAVGKGALFAALLPSLLEGDSVSQDAAAAQLGVSVANFRVQLHRLRMRYRDALRQEIVETLGLESEGEFAAEMAYLATISRGWV